MLFQKSYYVFVKYPYFKDICLECRAWIETEDETLVFFFQPNTQT